LAAGDIIPNESDTVVRSLDTLINSMASTNTNLSGRSFPQNGPSQMNNNYRYRDRDKNAGDLTTDQYFVTIETYDEQ
jgi:hypothetical protein